MIGEGKRADRCWRIARAITFISTTSGVRVKGVLMMGKLIWLMGPSGSGKIACWRNSACGNKLSYWWRIVHHARRQRRKRKPYRPERAGFFTRAGQNLLALSWHANGLYMASASRSTSGCTPDSTCWSRLTRPSAAGAGALSIGAAARCLQVSPEILRQRLENRGREKPVKLTPAWRAPPAILHRIANAQQ